MSLYKSDFNHNLYNTYNDSDVNINHNSNALLQSSMFQNNRSSFIDKMIGALGIRQQEGFTNDDKTQWQKIQTQYAKETTELIELQDLFDTKLKEYSITYELYLQQLNEQYTSNKTKYFGKNISDSTGTLYYITKQGIARPYTNETWNARNKSCINDPISINGTIESLNFPRGTPMTQNEPCGYEGENIVVGSYLGNPTNVATLAEGATARQSSTYYAGYPATKVLDGNLNTFNHTKNGNNEWIEIELKEPTTINNIYIHNRKNCCWNRLRNFTVIIKDTNQNEIYRKQMTQSTNKQRLYTITGLNVIGKYIRIQQNVKDYLHLSIVEVIGRKQLKQGGSVGNIGYVTRDGILRPYEDNLKYNETGTCPTTDPRVVSSEVWHSFNRGEQMKKTDICMTNEELNAFRKTIQKNNTDLMNIAEEIYTKIDVFKTKLESSGIAKETIENYLDTLVGNFESLLEQMNTINTKALTIDAMVEDTQEKHTIFNYNYLLWTVLTGLILLFAYRKLFR